MPHIPDLGNEQKEEIKSIMLNTREAVMPLQNQPREKWARLKTLRTADNVDMNAIYDVIDEISSLRAEMMKERLASEQEVRNLLTKEQRVIFDSHKMRLNHQRMFKRHTR